MRIARLIASACGVGYAPMAAGTVTSAVTLLPGALLLHISPALLSLVALLTVLIGVWAIRSAAVEGDPAWVVIDEVAGQLLALCGLLYVTLSGLLAAFLLFRVLDIVKPGPIRWADKQNGATAIMADDVIAGALAAAILWAVRSQWPGLF